MIFNVYIYNRRGYCLFYKEYSRPFNSLQDDPEEERRLVFGMLFSMKDMTSKLSPSVVGSLGREENHPSNALRVIKAGNFHLHHFESVTGIMIVINSDTSISGTLEYTDILYNIQ